SVTRDNRFNQTIVRVQLTDGRGDDAALFDNEGILTFRADGTLADYHSPLPSEGTLQTRGQSNRPVSALVQQARQFGLGHHGTPLAIVRRPGGQFSVEARVLRSEGINCWLEVFSLERPAGERREVMSPEVPPLSGLQPSGIQILTADDLNP